MSRRVSSAKTLGVNMETSSYQMSWSVWSYRVLAARLKELEDAAYDDTAAFGALLMEMV